MTESTGKITAETIGAMKGQAPVAALTVYDYAMAKLVDRCDVPLMLVGDSLGMVVLGFAGYDRGDDGGYAASHPSGRTG